MTAPVKATPSRGLSSGRPFTHIRPRRVRTHAAGMAQLKSASISVEGVAASPADSPNVGRSGAAATALSEAAPYAVLMLGGYEEHPADPGSPAPKRYETMAVWGYDASAKAWKAVQCSGAPSPPPRMAHQAVSVGSFVWMIGGWHPQAGPEAQFLGDIWRLDTRSWEWRSVSLQGETLPTISRFQAIAVGNLIYIHHHRCSDHILTLDVSDPDKVTLSKVPVTGQVPPSRGLHSVTYTPACNKLVLFGGAPQQGPMFGDLYELDLTSHTWTQVTPTGTAPHARCSHTAAATSDGRHVFIMDGAYYKDEKSGGGGLQVLGDAFIYDTDTRCWVWPETSASTQLPAARNAAVVARLPGSEDTFLVQGGWVPFVSTFNDTHIVNLA